MHRQSMWWIHLLQLLHSQALEQYYWPTTGVLNFISSSLVAWVHSFVCMLQAISLTPRTLVSCNNKILEPKLMVLIFACPGTRIFLWEGPERKQEKMYIPWECNMVWWGIMNSPMSTPRSSSSRYSWQSAHGDNKQWAWKSEHGFSGNWYFALNLVLYGCENHALPHHICLHAYSSLLSMLPVLNQQTQLCQFSDFWYLQGCCVWNSTFPDIEGDCPCFVIVVDVSGALLEKWYGCHEESILVPLQKCAELATALIFFNFSLGFSFLQRMQYPM